MLSELPSNLLRAAHRQRISAQLPALGMLVSAGAVAWFALTAFGTPVPLGRALAILVFQTGVFAAASTLVRRDPEGPLVTLLATAACVIVGCVWVIVFTMTTSVAALAMFATLVVFGAAPMMLAWGLGPQLVFQGVLSVVWLVAIAIFPILLARLELIAAVGFANVMALAAAVWATRVFEAEVLARYAAAALDRQIDASAQAYRALAENALDFIWAADHEGRWIYVNESMARRAGSAAAAMVGRPMTEVLSDGTPAEASALVARLAAADPLTPQLLRLATVEGPRWVESVATATRGASGWLIAVQGVSRDVTERRRAEERLRASEERFRSVFNNAPIGVAVISPPGELVQANRALAAMLGYSETDIVGKTAPEIIHPEDLDAVRALVEATLAGERDTFAIEYRQLHRDGGVVWSQVKSFLERDAAGAPRHFIAQITDVTEQRAAEHALRTSEARYRGLVESQSEIVIRFDPSGGLTFVNDAYCDAYGVRREEAVGHTFWPIVHPEDAERLRVKVAETVGPPFHAQIECRSLTPRGWRWFQWEARGIRDEKGIVVEGQAAGRDVTERHEAEEALRASLVELRQNEEKLRRLAQHQTMIREEERKRLGFDLHDDVCQELVGIGILVESVRRRVQPVAADVTPDLTRVTSYLNEVVEHLRQLAGDLRPMLLHDLGLEGSLRSLAIGLTSDATHVSAIFPTAIPRLAEIVELTVYRIAQEALANAIRHAGARHITLTLATRRDRLSLEVHDDGRGFDPSQARLQALGLASMEERAQALMGRFEVRSRRGEGTTIALECPLADRAPASAA